MIPSSIPGFSSAAFVRSRQRTAEQVAWRLVPTCRDFVPDERFAAWDEWQTRGEHFERRAFAVEVLKQFASAPCPAIAMYDCSTLDLSGLCLTDLPECLPHNVVHLDLRNNQLRALPKHLPPSLKSIMLNDNELQHLPDALPEGHGAHLCGQEWSRSAPRILARFPDTAHGVG
jgi:hypothetical protein